MKKILALLLALLCACESSSFTGRVQFQVPMEPNHWDRLLLDTDVFLPPTAYRGENGAIIRTTGAHPILYIEKTSKDGYYKVIASQRKGKKNLSVILYTSDAKDTANDWHVEAKRLETVLRDKFGAALSVNYGAIAEIPY